MITKQEFIDKYYGHQPTSLNEDLIEALYTAYRIGFVDGYQIGFDEGVEYKNKERSLNVIGI